MFGKNPLLPPKKGDGQKLDVKEIFATFQGEGPFVGHPAVFLRLAGCNLACDFCDTDFDQGKELALAEVIATIKNLAVKNNKITHSLVVITGGEPLRQNIAPLCQKLIAANFSVQIETNGTLYRELPAMVQIICSPKNVNGYGKIRSDLLPRINAFKFLISAQNPLYNFVPDCGQSLYQTPIYVQPIDEYNPEKNRHNRELTLKIAAENGYRLSLQTHKIWEIA